MKTLIIAPHPDDEVLGVGGTLLKRKFQGHKLAWVIITKPSEIINWSSSQISKRESEIKEISKKIGFDKVYQLGFPAASLTHETIPSLINSINNCIQEFLPDEIFLPHAGDVHSDHQIVHKAVVSSTKSFRNSNLKKLIVYETLSETEYGLDKSKVFFPNLFVDISDFLDKKISLMKIYSSELGEFPFPRSVESISSLAKYRGSSCNCLAAEAFEIIKQIE
tara:strand:+ start:273 stop:935 length:663 start_codon:yes stop_codon:yes gene_type:complete